MDTASLFALLLADRLAGRQRRLLPPGKIRLTHKKQRTDRPPAIRPLRLPTRKTFFPTPRGGHRILTVVPLRLAMGGPLSPPIPWLSGTAREWSAAADWQSTE